MSERGLTPKQKHREGVFRRSADWQERVFCYAGPEGCAGRLDAAHWISAQRLREERRKFKLTGPRFAVGDPRHKLATVSLDTLLADDRNGVPLCQDAHHPAFDGKRAKRLILTPPSCVIEFAEDYGLSHLLESAPDLTRRVGA